MDGRSFSAKTGNPLRLPASCQSPPGHAAALARDILSRFPRYRSARRDDRFPVLSYKTKSPSQRDELFVEPRPGIEPGTYALRVRRSTD